MFSELLDKVEGADIWMIASLMIFITFFIGVTIYVIRANKDHIQKMKNMPLNEDLNMGGNAL